MNIIVLDFTIFSPFLRVLSHSPTCFVTMICPLVFFLSLSISVCVARAALCVERNVGSTPSSRNWLFSLVLVRRSLFLSLLLDLEVRVSSIAGKNGAPYHSDNRKNHSNYSLFSTAADGQLGHPCTWHYAKGGGNLPHGDEKSWFTQKERLEHYK